MNYARIKNGVVVSICYFSDTSLIPAFAQGYDALVPLQDNVQGIECGDLYDSATQTFTKTTPQGTH